VFLNKFSDESTSRKVTIHGEAILRVIGSRSVEANGFPLRSSKVARYRRERMPEVLST